MAAFVRLAWWLNCSVALAAMCWIGDTFGRWAFGEWKVATGALPQLTSVGLVCTLLFSVSAILIGLVLRIVVDRRRMAIAMPHVPETLACINMLMVAAIYAARLFVIAGRDA
ncbi:hypothetical protein GCM10009552_43250 [Rothia nasimurium]